MASGHYRRGAPLAALIALVFAAGAFIGVGGMAVAHQDEKERVKTISAWDIGEKLDTMQAPPPLVAIAGRLGHPEGSVQGVPRFRWCSLSCCRARLYPVGTQTAGLRSGVRRLTKGVPFVPGLHSRKAGRLSLSRMADLPTSGLAGTYTLTRRQASVRVAAHDRIASRASRHIGSHALPDVDRFC